MNLLAALRSLCVLCICDEPTFLTHMNLPLSGLRAYIRLECSGVVASEDRPSSPSAAHYSWLGSLSIRHYAKSWSFTTTNLPYFSECLSRDSGFAELCSGVFE